MPETDPSNPPTLAELNEASNYYNGVPSEERKQKDTAFLLTTNIPYEYRSALERESVDRRLVKSNRPSNAQGEWRYTQGTMNGIEAATQGLFKYFFRATAIEVLEAAVAAINERTAKEPLDFTSDELRYLTEIMDTNQEQRGFDFWSAVAAMEAEDLNDDERKAVALIDGDERLASFAAGCGSDDLEERLTDEIERNDLDMNVDNIDFVKVMNRFQDR